jgi:hypothetical protein
LGSDQVRDGQRLIAYSLYDGRRHLVIHDRVDRGVDSSKERGSADEADTLVEDHPPIAAVDSLGSRLAVTVTHMADVVLRVPSTRADGLLGAGANLS